MGNKTAILSVKIIADAQAAVDGLGKVDTASQRMEKGFGKASVAAGIFIAALVAGALKVEGVASDLQQAAGGVDAVFGAYASSVHKFSETAATDVGLAKDQYDTLATLVGSQLKNMGYSLDTVGGKTNDLIGMGADLSAMFGGTAADAVSAISSLLKGERDPIERYGVSINQAKIEAEKLALGLGGLSGQADANATTQATLKLLMDQTRDSVGKFASEADTASGAQQRANAAWRDTQAALGEVLLPIFTKAADALTDLAKWIEENKTLALAIIIVLAILAVGIVVLTAAMWAFNLAAWANPVGIVILVIILAIGALIGIVLLVIKHFGDIERFGLQAFNVITLGINTGANAITGFINLVIDAINWLIKLGSGELIGNGVLSLFGIEGKGNTPQIAHLSSPKLPTVTGSQINTVVNNTTNVSGALDANGVANQIKSLLANQSQTAGATPAAGGSGR